MSRLKIEEHNVEAIAAIAAALGMSQTKALNRFIEDLAVDYLDHIQNRPRPRLVANTIQSGSNLEPSRLPVESTTGSNVVPIHTSPVPARDPLIDRLGGLLEQF